MRTILTCATALAATLAIAIVSHASVGAPPAPAAVISGPPAGRDMVRTFTEDFDGAAIDQRKWNLAYGPRTRSEPPVGSRSLWSNGEAQIYFDSRYLHLGIDPFAVAGGQLTITARPLSATARDAVFGDLNRYPDLLRGQKTPPHIDYSSGAITTRDIFAQRYGYFEIRAAWSSGKGIWPAFWLLPANGAWPPEIDVVEAHGDKPETAFQSMHSARQPTVTNTAKVAGSQQDFHTYGVLWQPGRLDFFVDGVQTSTAPEPADMNQPMYLLANLAIGGYWPGYPAPDPQFTAAMRIDFIRVWQFRGPRAPGAAGGG